jgi:hypothetical protein
MRLLILRSEQGYPRDPRTLLDLATLPGLLRRRHRSTTGLDASGGAHAASRIRITRGRGRRGARGSAPQPRLRSRIGAHAALRQLVGRRLLDRVVLAGTGGHEHPMSKRSRVLTWRRRGRRPGILSSAALGDGVRGAGARRPSLALVWADPLRGACGARCPSRLPRRDGHDPLDAWFVYPPVARLFREQAERLALAIHGNDYTSRELWRPRPEEEPTAILAQALRRIERLEARSAVELSVMVAPTKPARSRPCVS